MKAKRSTSLLLAVVMSASLVTAVPVSAASPKDIDPSTQDSNYTYSSQRSPSAGRSFVVDNISNVTYNGTSQTPKPVVTDGSGIVLRENQDYVLSYRNNRDAGQASIHVEGAGTYAGISTDIYFNIRQADLRVSVNDVTCRVNEAPSFGYKLVGGKLFENDRLPEPQYTLSEKVGNTAKINVSFGDMPNYNIIVTKGTLTYTSANVSSLSDVTYNGSYQTPKPTVTDSSGAVLVEDYDYTLHYRDNYNAGTAYVEVRGIGRYAGQINETVSFNIKRAPLTIQVNDIKCTSHDNPQFTYTITGGQLFGSDDLGSPTYKTKSKTGHSYGPKFDIEVSFPSSSTANYDLTIRKGLLTYTDIDYQSFLIDVDCSYGGSVSPSGRTYVYEGESQTIRFTPRSGYEVIAVYVDGKDVGSRSSFTFYDVSKDHKLYVDFAPISSRYEINADSSFGGSISPSGTVRVDRGDNRTFWFTPNQGYVVDSVYVDKRNIGSVDRYTFDNIRSDHTIYVEFSRTNALQYKLEAEAGTGGRISPAGNVWASKGTSKTFNFYPNPGYKIAAVYVDGYRISGTPDSYRFNDIRSDHSIRVEFVRSGSTVSEFLIEADCGSGGSISPSGNIWVNRGSSKTFTFRPNSGNKVSAVYVDGRKLSSTANSYTFNNVSESHRIYVEFSKGSYEIQADYSSGGRISPSGSTSVSVGTSKTFNFSPNSGYGILGVYVDGEYVGNDRSYTFRNVNEDHKLYVQFAKKADIQNEYTIRVIASNHGTVSPFSGGQVRVKRGSDQSFTFMPDRGYRVARLYVDDKLVSTENTYLFKAVVGDHTLRVEFEPGMPLRNPTDWTNRYVDVQPGNWFFDAVRFMSGNGLIEGTSATTFSPNATTTRGMIVTMLYRIEGSPNVALSGGFRDVSASAWFGSAVNWAAYHGIVSGYSDGMFHPNDAVTREQMACILYRYAEYRGLNTKTSSDIASRFIDYPRISSYAVTPMSWAYANGIISGTSTYTLNPSGTATRAEIAAMLSRFCQNFLM